MARVLVMEDDESVREVVVAVLHAGGHTVKTAVNGKEGLALFRADPADIIITDIVMPEQDGVGVVMSLRAVNPDVPIVAISGNVMYSALYLGLAQKLGAKQILQKPFTPKQLLDTVAQVLADAKPSA
jgi:CheY-like chemotaxis protein